MALRIQTPSRRSPSQTDQIRDIEALESNPKIVRFTIVSDQEAEVPAQTTDLGSFERLMLGHLDAAHNLARWLLRNEQDAQDVVQEAYLRAFRSFASFKSGNGRAWLLTIVRNTSYTLLKKNHAVDLTTSFDDEIHGSCDESLSPAALLELSEETDLIKEALEQLPADAREILALRDQEELSYKEIASVMQVPQGTVMSRLARARGKLKEYLATRLGEDE